MRVRFVFLTFLLICIHVAAQAQEKCATVPYMQNLLQKHGIQQTTEQFEEWLQRKQSLRNQENQTDRLQAGPYKIPIVVHVIHNGVGSIVNTEITDARIQSQIEVLNNDFQRMNADAINTPSEFQPVAGTMDIEFVLAKQTPEGSATTGIVRVNGMRSSWSAFDPDLQATSYWPSEDYLNIWVTNLSGAFLGYAQFPVSNLSGLEEYQDGIAETDGVVIDYTVFGVGSSNPDYDQGRTTTHEVGHFLGLRHIWGDENNCTGSDYVSDTPNQADETYGCVAHPASDVCSSMKMFQNYMDYTDDECMNLFTAQQISRMTLILDDTDVPRRNSLLSSLGLEEPIAGTIDLEMVNMTRPGPVTCDDTPLLTFTVTNHSTEPITDLKIRISVNGEWPETESLTGLNLTGTGAISVESPDLEIGENLLSINVIQINGATDPVTSNNLLQENISIIHPECEPFAIYFNESGTVDITFNLQEPQTVNLSVVDIMGREIVHGVLPDILNQTFPVPVGGVSTGLYIIRLQIDKKYYTTKVYLSP